MLMDRVLVKCPAKINLSLDVVGKLDNGYHKLEMIMQSVGLYDIVTLEKNNAGINIYCDNKSVPLDEKNICHRVASNMKKEFGLPGGIDITIIKNIPIAAGLAGGSTDAAGVIVGVNKLYELNLSKNEMMDIGVLVGADVPFCINGGTAFVTGIGEVIKELPLLETWCVLAKPDVSVSTSEVFKRFKFDEVLKHPDTYSLLEYVNKGEIEQLSQNMVNVLEVVTTKEYPVIFDIKNIMMEFDALGSLMSGSGPTVFGLFEDKNIAEKCYHRLRDYLKEVYLVKTKAEIEIE
jgi:4-diphosphocytidyl-2-C-methyl-D-erythritol kinase